MALRNYRSNQDSLFHPFSDQGLFGPLFNSNHYDDVSPKVDIFNKEKEVVVLAELAGFKKEDLHIDFSDNGRQLTLSGTKKKDETHKQGDATFSERSYGSFSRSFTLPYGCKPDDIKAKYDNGILEVIIPHDPSTVQRKIQIY